MILDHLSEYSNKLLVEDAFKKVEQERFHREYAFLKKHRWHEYREPEGGNHEGSREYNKHRRLFQLIANYDFSRMEGVEELKIKIEAMPHNLFKNILSLKLDHDHLQHALRNPELSEGLLALKLDTATFTSILDYPHLFSIACQFSNDDTKDALEKLISIQSQMGPVLLTVENYRDTIRMQEQGFTHDDITITQKHPNSYKKMKQMGLNKQEMLTAVRNIVLFNKMVFLNLDATSVKSALYNLELLKAIIDVANAAQIKEILLSAPSFNWLVKLSLTPSDISKGLKNIDSFEKLLSLQLDITTTRLALQDIASFKQALKLKLSKETISIALKNKSLFKEAVAKLDASYIERALVNHAIFQKMVDYQLSGQEIKAALDNPHLFEHMIATQLSKDKIKEGLKKPDLFDYLRELDTSEQRDNDHNEARDTLAYKVRLEYGELSHLAISEHPGLFQRLVELNLDREDIEIAFKYPGAFQSELFEAIAKDVLANSDTSTDFDSALSTAIERYFVCKNQLQYLEKPLKF